MIANFDVLAIGNATVDAFVTVLKSNKDFKLNRQTNELSIKFGCKTKIDKIDFSVGGNAVNVSVGLSRMGFKTAIAAEIGSDEFAPKIINDLRKEGVSEILLKQTPNSACRFAIVITYKKERTVLGEDIKRNNDFNFEGISTKWIYLTSLEEKWLETYKRALFYAKTSGAKIAFNPGTTQIKKGRISIENVLKETDLLFLNKEEAKILIKGETKIESLAKKLHNLGAKTVVITDGENGSFLYNKEEGFLKHGIIKRRVLGKAGAGDAYASGFLAAVLSEKTLKQAMKWGSFNAAYVVSKIGTQTGLLTKKEIEDLC